MESEIFNDQDSTSLSQNGLLFIGVLLGLNLGYMFLNVFKAREMRSALELTAADRRLMRRETIVSAGGDAVDLSI